MHVHLSHPGSADIHHKTGGGTNNNVVGLDMPSVLVDRLSIVLEVHHLPTHNPLFHHTVDTCGYILRMIYSDTDLKKKYYSIYTKLFYPSAITRFFKIDPYIHVI